MAAAIPSAESLAAREAVRAWALAKPEKTRFMFRDAVAALTGHQYKHLARAFDFLVHNGVLNSEKRGTFAEYWVRTKGERKHRAVVRGSANGLVAPAAPTPPPAAPQLELVPVDIAPARMQIYAPTDRQLDTVLVKLSQELKITVSGRSVFVEYHDTNFSFKV